MEKVTFDLMFVDDALAWRRTGDEALLRRLIRSSGSGVPHDIGAAYATLAARTGNLLDAIDAGRLALPAADRDAVIAFSRRMRRIRALPDDMPEEAVRSVIPSEVMSSRACHPEPVIPSLSSRACHPERSRGTRDEVRGAQPFDSAASFDSAADDTSDGDIELAEPLEAEAPSAAPPWQRHFSASALNTYAECAREWFYRYACAAVEDPGSSASAYGTAFHLALEDFHGDFPRPRGADEYAMRKRIRECVTWAFERNRDGFETAVEFQLQVRRARRTAERYVDWLLAQEREAPFEVLGREVAAEIDLDGRPFVGYIDRLDRYERSGEIGVVDYKTGSIATSPAEYCEKVRAFEDFQLPFYYWARTAAGDRVARLILIPLKNDLVDVRPVVLEVGKTIGIDLLERSRDRMVELSGALASGETSHFSTTDDPSACTFCCYAPSCANKPPAEASRFGS